MLEVKSIATSEWKTLKELAKENWKAQIVVEDRIIIYRESKKQIKKYDSQDTREYIEFRNEYKRLSQNGIYDPLLKNKYNKLVEQGLHEKIMYSLPNYEKECFALNRPFKNAMTFINQRTWEQSFKVTKSKDDNWINPYLEKETVDVIEWVKERKTDWIKANPQKKFTEGILKNMIDKAREIYNITT